MAFEYVFAGAKKLRQGAGAFFGERYTAGRQSFFDHVAARDGFRVGNDFPINLDAVARPECGIEFDQKAEDANPLP